jgi:hypothetical protein
MYAVRLERVLNIRGCILYMLSSTIPQSQLCQIKIGPICLEHWQW